MPNTLHVISHTHWDREWYMPFEQHRLRLVALMDMLLDIFEGEPEFRHFHMDGQMIPYEDYLAVRPDKADALQRAIEAGKLSLGPWYVLQDEALTSSEANVRNMMYGLKLARRLGRPLMVGYLPDTFGHFSQMPQLLNGFGIQDVVFGRGVNAYDAQRATDPQAEAGEVGYKSELTWRSPDGSEVLAVFMANWYANAMDIPSDPSEAAGFLRQARDNALRFATTSQLLMMNGCDHTPIKPDVGRVVRAAEELMDDEIVHTDLASYFAALRRHTGELQVARGELRSEYTNGWTTLADTLSARMYEKQANWWCQQLLERWVEPLTAFASVLGEKHPTDQTWYAWATLMQNHPHDSICGCSCDEVHREVDLRFAKSQQVGEGLRDAAAQALANRVSAQADDDASATVLVLNPLPGSRTGTVHVQVEFPEDVQAGQVEAVDADGNRLAVSQVHTEPGWSYQLPDDRFRVSSDCRRATCQILVPDVPGAGYKTIVVRPVAHEAAAEATCEVDVLENDHLRVRVNPDGVLDIVEKASGVSFEGLNLYEDGGDCGDEYIYRSPQADAIITTAGDDSGPAPGCLHSEIGSWAALEHRLVVPVQGDAAARSEQTAEMQVSTELWLPRGARHLAVSVHIDNPARDHRLRALFPTHIAAECCYADSQFDIVERQIQPWGGWHNPSNPQPQQAFVDISDPEKGLCIANRGLPCYEVLRDGRGTIALTLLRCVGRIGDWGDFATPEAQCIGANVAQYAIIPHAGHIMDPEQCDAARIAWEYATPMWATQVKHFMYPHKERWTEELPAQAALVSLEPRWLALSCVRRAEQRDSLVVRLYNPFDLDTQATIRCLWDVKQAYTTNLAEDRQDELAPQGSAVAVSAPAKQIVTVELVV